jgi:hypothetical protein
LLYTNYQSAETISNWIVDTDTGEKWETGKGLAGGGWSPSGRHMDFHTLSPSPIEIWMSDNVGRDIRRILDSRKYPDLEIKGYDWLNDETILVNVVDKTGNRGFLYALNVSSLSFERIGEGNFMKVPPDKNFWIQWTNQYHLMGLDKNMTPLTLLSSDLYFFSPDGNQLAYFCDRKEDLSSICLADIGMDGITNEHKFADVETNIRTLDIWWSQDGKYVGIHTYNRSTTETRFRAIDISNGSNMYDWAFPTKTSRNFWSPSNDKIIDYDGLLLNLKTGKVRNFFAEINEPTPSYIVDWKMIEVP